MFSRLATVLQELSGEEGQDGETQESELAPQLPANAGEAAAELEVPEEVKEHLAHLEQLVVQLKELIRDKDTQLAGKDELLKNEREKSEARFSKLKLQAKAKITSLSKQIDDLKGQGGATTPDSSFSSDVAAEGELQELQSKLREDEAKTSELLTQLQATEKLLEEKDAAHAEQLKHLQAVVHEKDVRFQEQIQKHEEELLRATAQSSNDGELQQALHVSQRRCEELEEALKSRSQVLEMLQQEVTSADQQKQILTAEFRQMEGELAEAVKQRQEWAQRFSEADAALQKALERASEEAAKHERELSSLSHAASDSLEKERTEVARLEKELALMNESAVACRDASERDKLEIFRLEKELTSTRELESEVIQASRSHLEETKSEVARLEQELVSFQEGQEESQKKSHILAEIWRHLQPLTLCDVEPSEDTKVPDDLCLVLDTVLSIETQMTRLKDDHRENEEHSLEAKHTMEALQDQLDRSISEKEDAMARVKQLEQQIELISEKDSEEPRADVPSEADRVALSALEQQLSEKDNELGVLRQRLRMAEEQSTSDVASAHIVDQPLDQTETDDAGNNCAMPPDCLEDTQEDETTLVAEDTSVLSLTADTESSPELIEQQESPEESKGASSDEMVTSTDSEVAHSSWTLLEAVNQDGRQEWPSVVQDFGQLQSWETASMEQETSTTSVTSSSVVIRETVAVHIMQEGASPENVSTGLFAQALAEELQKRYSELLAELETLREEAAVSHEKIKSLEVETQRLTAEKEAAVSRASDVEEELKSARGELQNLSQQSRCMAEKHSAEICLLEEQINILSNDSKDKEQKIQALHTELKMARQALSEQDNQALMLNAQLEDRELLSSELQRKLQQLESNMLERSQMSALDSESLSKKESEICELQLRLSQKEQQMTELDERMSAKLSQVEEERALLDGEVNKLKEQLVEVQQLREETSSPEMDEELVSLRRSKEEFETQLVTTKKKLQVVLVQRKELTKKVSDLETALKKNAEKDETAAPETSPEVEKYSAEEMQAKVAELEQTLRSKDEAIENLHFKMSQQEKLLSETLALNRELSKDTETQQANNYSDNTLLRSQVASLETECETLQKKVLEAQESRKESIRKAKEKDRHHRDQLKQQKEEYTELMGRFELQSGEREVLLTKVQELEDKMSPHEEERKDLVAKIEKTSADDWVQEDWVDFAAAETDSVQHKSSVQGGEQLSEQSEVLSAQTEEPLKAVREEIEAMEMANLALESKLQEAQTSLSQKVAELQDVSKEPQALRENERQIEALSDEIIDLREKYRQAESCAEALKAEMEAASVAASSQSASSIAALQAEVEDFKLFLDKKNLEITELSQQLREQNTLILSMQDTVGHKDQLIASLEQELKVEQEKSKQLEVEVPQRQEEEDSEAKLQQLQRKLQAALISRKEVLKESKTQKERLRESETLIVELQQKMQTAQDELQKVRAERTRLIDEVDRMLLENQSLGSSCESLKLAMDAIASEKDACRREGELAKEEAARMCKEWEEKVNGMKDEYETLLRSYENVSNEAERVRRVLEAARQERQELAAKVRSNDASREEAETRAEEARKEVEVVKDKMRKFVKGKQQKILELEEEMERLREGQEKTQMKSEDDARATELSRLREELQTLKVELNTAVAERDALTQVIEQMKERFQHLEVQDNTAPLVGEVRHSDPVLTETEMVESKTNPEESPDDHTSSISAVVIGSEPTMERALFEDKIKEMEVALNSERESWQEREAQLKAGLASLERDLQESNEKESLMASLEECLQESKEREKCLIEEGTKREVQFKDLLKNLESEKDNLEERLMDQLAQLNGSIARYQQEAADHHKQLAELQRDVERLEKERAELDAEARAQLDRAARLEEDFRQAQRQRAEAETEMGKQRELEQQLRSAQRVKEGSQSRARQLEELLREKQLEVRQLQKDSIHYQERISELGVEVKALQLGHDELSKNLAQSQEETRKNLQELKKTEAELASCKSTLNEAKEQLSQVTLEKTTLEKNIHQKEALWKAEAEQTLDSVRFRLGAELKEMELRLEEAYREREKEEEATLEAREAADAAESRAQEMQARLDESLARLAAFSRCMSSLQDDRDRVLDEARQWETRFNDALLAKEAEIRDTETRAKELAENLQKESALKEELQLRLHTLEKADQERQLKLDEAAKKLNGSQAELEREHAELLQTTAELQSAQSEVRLLKGELESHSQRVRALEEAVGRLQEDIGKARAELRDREADDRRLCLTLEQLEADLHSSKALTETLQVALHDKEKREVDMLDEKEQAVSQAADEARKEAEGRAREAEEELERKRRELRDLEEKLRLAEVESDSRRAKLDSFTKAMGSLQDDRERVLSMYKQLEEKHLQVMVDKDALIQEAASESNSLKEDLRSLLVQRDDLYAEKAKLSAQLHGYRDELKQVLSMKDSQHKQLLAAQRDRITSLEKERDDLESALKKAGESEAVKVEQVMPLQAVNASGAEVEKLREQLETARQKVQAMEENLLKEREAHERETKELSELRWEGGLMRTESESAQERVAELARDLLAVEQKLLAEKELVVQLKAENQSFGKAMASLQDSKDQAERKACRLSLELDEATKVGSLSPSSSGEVWSLKNALQALQNDRERLLEQLQAQTMELKTNKSQLARLGAGELIKVGQELFEEKNKNAHLAGIITEMENMAASGKQEIEMLRLERVDWMAQAEQLKQQTLSTLSERDQQLRQLTAMLEEARAHTPKYQKEQYHREASREVDSAPGAPQERSSLQEGHASLAELSQLQQRLDEETQQRLAAEEQLLEAQDRLRRQSKWEDHSETAVFIEPPAGGVTRTRRGATPGLMRALRSGMCWRRRTPLLLAVYLLSVHVLLLLCLGGFL